MAASRIQRGPMRSRRLHLRDFNLRSGAANLQRPPNKRLEKDLRPARYARRSRPLSLGVEPQEIPMAGFKRRIARGTHLERRESMGP